MAPGDHKSDSYRRLVAVALELPRLGNLGIRQVLQDPRKDVVRKALSKSSPDIRQSRTM